MAFGELREKIGGMFGKNDHKAEQEELSVEEKREKIAGLKQNLEAMRPLSTGFDITGVTKAEDANRRAYLERRIAELSVGLPKENVDVKNQEVDSKHKPSTNISSPKEVEKQPN